MGILKGYFLQVFQLVYPLIHNHLVSYVLFFVLFAMIGWKNWKHIKKRPKGSIGLFVLWVIQIAFEILLGLFLAWFLLDHFPSFMSLDCNY